MEEYKSPSQILAEKIRAKRAKEGTQGKELARAPKNQALASKPKVTALAKFRKTYYVEVRDHSGSMRKVREAIIAACNENLAKARLRANDPMMETTATIVNFGSKVHPPVLFDEPMDKIPVLTGASFNPTNEWTALYDGIGATIEMLESQPDIMNPDTFVYFVIISDGEENRSVRFNAGSIAALIDKCKATRRWNFVYIGANQNLADVSAVLGISRGNMLSYTANAKGIALAGKVNQIAFDKFSRKASKGQNPVSDDSVDAPKNNLGIPDIRLLE